MRKLFKIILFLLISWFSIHVIYIFYDGLKNDENKADIAVVLGNKVNEDGTLSNRLEKRLECALHAYQTGRISKILVSGGLGKEGFLEGDKMSEYLIQKGIPRQHILIDNFGSNTEATVRNTKKICDENGFDSVLIISQYYHITRTKKLFRLYGFNQMYSAAPVYFEWRDIYSVFREFIAFYI